MNNRSETLFVSDLHLDDARPELSSLFLNFLKEHAAQAEALYILGDLFEVWIGDDAVQPEHQAAIDALEPEIVTVIETVVETNDRWITRYVDIDVDMGIYTDIQYLELLESLELQYMEAKIAAYQESGVYVDTKSDITSLLSNFDVYFL